MRSEPPWKGLIRRWRSAFEARLPGRIRRRVRRVPLLVRTSLSLTRSVGRYLPPWRRRGHSITLTPFLTAEEAWETFGHELAHFVEKLVWPPRKGDLHHGPRWREVMGLFGLAPQPGHRYPLRRRRREWQRAVLAARKGRAGPGARGRRGGSRSVSG